MFGGYVHINTEHTLPKGERIRFDLVKNSIQPGSCPRPHIVGQLFGQCLELVQRYQMKNRVRGSQFALASQ